MSKSSDVHIAVQQCLANELGITKDLIKEMVEKRINKLLNKKVDNMMKEGSLKEMITHRINIKANQGLYCHGLHTVKFDEYIKACIDDRIKQIIDTNYDIKITVKEQP